MMLRHTRVPGFFYKKYILLGSDMVVSDHDHKPLGTLRATFSAIRSGFLK